MFNEKKTEYSIKSRQEVPVIQSAKYIASRDKALKAINDRPYLKESDFWILMNETKTGKMMYTGLIISHNACLKINDNMPEKDKFNPDCVSVDKSGYGNSLVFTYANKQQGLYEVGEASAQNCKNAYPYAMAWACGGRTGFGLSSCFCLAGAATVGAATTAMVLALWMDTSLPVTLPTSNARLTT